MSQSRFLTDGEKVEFFAEQVQVDMKDFPHKNVLKVYEGSKILLYHWHDDDLVIFDSILMCTGLMTTGAGMTVSFVDCHSHELHVIDDYPLLMASDSLVVKVPSRCLVERTIMRDGPVGHLEGVTAVVDIYTKCSPVNISSHPQAVALNAAKKFFGHNTYANAIKLEGM